MRSFHLLLLSLGVAFLLSTPALAISDLTVQLTPLQPLSGEDFTVIVEGTSEEGVELNDVTIGPEDFGSGTEIRVTLDEGCAPSCATGDFRLEIPIGASADFPEGDHALSIFRLDAMSQQSLLLQKRFAIGVIYDHFLEHTAYLKPDSPTDNDLIRLVVPSQANVCGPTPAEFEGFERVGSVLNVYMSYSAGFGGGFVNSPGEKDGIEKCSPALPYSYVELAELGVLDAGHYRVDFYLREEGEFGSLPIRTQRRDLTVIDAPDLVELQGGRFEVRIDWRDFENLTGVGQPVPGASDDSTLFSFFGDDNWEVLVKVLDACTLNGKFWVLTAAATTVEYNITITDTLSGEDWTFDNPLGNPSPAVTDIEAFDCSP